MNTNNNNNNDQSNWNENNGNSSMLAAFKPAFDLPKLSLFESDEYLYLVSQYQMLYRENEDPKSIFYNYLNVGLTYKDMDALYNQNITSPSVMVFMINYLHNEEALRGEMKPHAFVTLFRVHDWKKEIFDAMEEWCEYLDVPEFSKKQHKYLCEIIQLNNRWILMIANLRKKSAVIVDFKYNEEFPLQQILTIFTTITKKSYDIDISSFSIEAVLFSAPEQTDGGYYLINYLWKFINGAQFDRIKFTKNERSFLQQNVLWFILKLRSIKPSIDASLSESMTQSKYSSHVSKRQQLFSQSSGKKYMKIVQAVIRKQEMAVQTPAFMMGDIPKLLPRVDAFREWNFEPIKKPVIEEFGNKIADVISVLDDKYKMKLLQTNSNEYKFLLEMLEEKISQVEKRRKIQEIRSTSSYKRNYAKQEDNNNNGFDEGLNEEGYSGFESIVRDSIAQVKQEERNRDFQAQQEMDELRKANLLINYPDEQDNNNEDLQLSASVQYLKNNNNINNNNSTDNNPVVANGNVYGNNNTSTVLDKLKMDQSMIKSLADIEGEEYDEIRPFEEVLPAAANVDPAEISRRIKANYEDVSDASIYGISQEVTDTTIHAENALAGGKFNAFLNHYDHSKNYLEQYNLYYNPKKYLELDREMEKLKISMNQHNLEYKMLLEAQANPNQDGLTKARKNMRDMSATSMSFSKSQILLDIDKSIHNESTFQPPVNATSIFRDKNVSVFSRNSTEILGYPKANSLYCNDFHPTEQSQYSKLLTKKPTDFRRQPDQPIQKIKFNQNLQVVKSQSQMLMNIGKQSLEMRKGGEGAAMGIEDILFQKVLQEKKFRREAKATDKPVAVSMLENPFKINVSYAMMMQMLQTDYIAEEITNFCVSYFQKKVDARKLEGYKLLQSKKFLMLPSDFYFVLTYDVQNKKDSMSAETIFEKVDTLNFTMCRPYYETHGNIFENFDYITIPLCLKHYKESTNDLRLEYWLIVVDINERMLRLYVFSRDNPAVQELYLSQVLTNIMRWLEFEYQWVFMQPLDAYRWRVVKGQTSTTPDIPKTGYYMIFCLTQLILGFNKCENVTSQMIETTKKNIAATLVKVANNYSANLQPITDFLSYPL